MTAHQQARMTAAVALTSDRVEQRLLVAGLKQAAEAGLSALEQQADGLKECVLEGGLEPFQAHLAFAGVVPEGKKIVSTSYTKQWRAGLSDAVVQQHAASLVNRAGRVMNSVGLGHCSFRKEGGSCGWSVKKHHLLWELACDDWIVA